ncbi:uncharacterized protein A4U43_C01F30470 [Asparagus officinalis]|uniref:Endoplasmic reticulum vesicle transporter C-terminal domain-containing protein n=1 Tax=Asparagus officinalis TaxID=4686 RepID=A0A5P1FTC3_ASPOF|nr:uncharacterized protein A4U43_C01F30470 [Asparagus officinalis]
MAASPSAEWRFLYPVISISFISLLLFLSAISGLTASSYFLFSRLPTPSSSRRGPAALPSFAYLITGARGDASSPPPPPRSLPPEKPFSVTEHFGDDSNVHPKPPPGVYFIYDFSPIKVIYTEGKVSFLHFLTNICAIIGGVFTVAGIIDSFIYHGQRAIKKKIDLGKHR